MQVYSIKKILALGLFFIMFLFTTTVYPYSSDGMDTLDSGGMDTLDSGGMDTLDVSSQSKFSTELGVYEGNIAIDTQTGDGTLTDKLGNIYNGYFTNGLLNGHGELTYNSGSKYVGNFSNNKSEGEGTYYYKDGSKYIGQFSKGMMHGAGVYYDTNGVKYDVEYSYGAYTKKVRTDGSTEGNSNGISDSIAKINSKDSLTPNNNTVVPFLLDKKNTGFSLQKIYVIDISDISTDFCISSGNIIGVNGAKVSGTPVSSIDEDKFVASLTPDNLKTTIPAHKDILYTIVSPNGYLGMFILVDIDVSKDSYKGFISSMRTDELVKAQLSTQSNAANPSNTNGMDTFDLGGMDTFELGDMDYFDTEVYTDLTNVFFEGNKKNLKISPRVYSNGEILISLRDIAQILGLSVEYNTSNGVENAKIVSGGKTTEIEAFSETATINSEKVKLNKASKMDKNGIMVPLSFLAKNYGVHFSANTSTNTILISKKPILEWRYGGYYDKVPYSEYENKFVDGVITKETRLNGKNHVFKNVTIYNKNTGKSMTVKENQVKSFSKEWSTTPSSAANKKDTASSISFWSRYNMHNFFNSSTFNTWGGSMIRRIVP